MGEILEFGEIMDWYEAEVIDNLLLGSTFPVSSTCVFRCNSKGKSKKKFEIFNLKDTSIILTGEQAKIQLRSRRDRNNKLYRAKDQGYINWKFDNHQK